MMNRAPTESNGEPRPESAPAETLENRASMEELRELILGPEQRKLREIQGNLADTSRRAREVSEVLPEAILIRAGRDDRIAEALSPTIASILRTSIRRDSKALGEALFPVMGPAIRKSILNTLWSMIESLNQMLEHSVSVQGLKWRLEALRTRKSFAEIVLLHTLVYRVEQVLLIMTESGVLIQHVVAKEIAMEDPDLVSGMLTAIQDFVRDSFGASIEDTLETLRMGDRIVRVEQHGGLTMAAVIRGNPPADFGLRMMHVLETVYLKKAEEIDAFEGDPDVFEEIRPDLEDCLETKLQKEEKRPSPFLWAILAIVLILLGVWLYREVDERQRMRQIMATLQEHPGLMVSSMEKKDGRIHIRGFKDPLAEPPGLNRETTGVDADAIRYHWAPFFSLDPHLVLKRLRQQAPPPETAAMGLVDGRIVIEGASMPQWPQAVRRSLATMAAGITLESQNLVDISMAMGPPAGIALAMDGRRLTATGEAPHQWIEAARRTAATLPGISDYVDQSVTDTDLAALERLKTDIEAETLYFSPGTSRLNDRHRKTLQILSDQVSAAFALTRTLARPIHLAVIGQADSSGAESVNLRISKARADAVRDFLTKRGLDADKITSRGIGETTADREKTKKTTRRVTFVLILTETPPIPGETSEPPEETRPPEPA
ncbi:MAG: OmpA family protein [Desulfobacterales bacterium]|nr:OmpA family protein [Desulfobacterales bacterium]